MYTARSRTKAWHRFISVTLAFMLIIGTLPASLIYAAEGDEAPATASNAGLKWLTYKFDLNDFSDPAQQALFQLNGNANFADGRLMVNPRIPANIHVAGSGFNKQSFQPHQDFSFSTGFSFVFNTNTGTNSADGMTFAIVNDLEGLGSTGGGMGIGGIVPSFALKFDTYYNSGFKDPSNNFIGIVIDGNLNNNNPSWYKDLNAADMKDASGNTKFILGNGKTYYTWLDYNGTTNNLKVYLNDASSKPSNPIIDANEVDLKEIFQDTDAIYTGFTGVGFNETHEILSWYFVNDFAPIGSLDDTSGYQQAPSSVDMDVNKTSTIGKYKVTITAKNADDSSVAHVPIEVTSSKSGVWTDETGTVITDWTTMLTNAEGQLLVYFVPNDPFTISDLRAVAVGGAIATGEAPAYVPIAPGGVEGAALWLKSSNDVEAGSDGKVTTWTDQTTGKVFSTDETKDGVTWDVSKANFNPAVAFDGNGMMLGDEETNINVKELFAAAKHNIGNIGAIFATKPSASNKQGFFRGSTVQFINHTGIGGVGAARTLNTPNNHANDSMRLQAASAPKMKGWENGVVTLAPGAFTDTGNAFELKLGATNQNDYFLSGFIGELIVFDENRLLSEEELLRINSYLALKYGVTLKDESGNPTDYIASDGNTKIWTKASNEGFGNRITAIGRDDNSGLLQKQSKAQTTGANVSIALGDSLEASNVDNKTDISIDKTFFAFSDDDGGTEFEESIIEEPSTGHLIKKMERVYKVQASANWSNNSVQNVTLKLDVTQDEDAPVYNYYLLTSEDGETFAQPTEANKLNSEYEITVNSNSLKYFTFAKVYKEDLKDSITNLPAYDELDFTEESWDKFQLAKTNAENVLVDGSSSQQAIDEALEALQEAIDALLLKIEITEPEEDTVFIAKPEIKGIAAPGSTVTVKIGAAEAMEVTVDEKGNWSYTPDKDLTDGEYEIVVKATKDGKQNTDSKTIKVDATLPAVAITKPAANETVYVSKPTIEGTTTPGSTVTLKIGETEVPVEVDENGNWSYTLESDLSNGEHTVEVTATKDGKTNRVTQKIEVDVTTPAVDKSKLQAKSEAIDEAITEGTLKGADYTADSWKALQDAQAAAKAVLADVNVTQEAVDEALEALNQAHAGLVPVPTTPAVDKSKLQAKSEAIDEAIEEGTLKGADYTADSWKALQAAQAAAKAVLANANATQAEVDSALAALTEAHKELVEVEEPTAPVVDKTALQAKSEAIDEAITDGTLKGADYTADSWKALQAAQAAAKVVLADANATQAEVDSALAALSDAYAKLVKAPTSPGNGGGTVPTPAPTPTPTPESPIISTADGSKVPFASASTVQTGDRSQITIKVERDKLSELLNEGKGQKLGIQVPGSGDVDVQGLTVEDLKKLVDTGSSLDIEDLLAIYPVPAEQLKLDEIVSQFGNTPLSEIAVNIKIKRSSEALANLATEQVAAKGYELLVHPVEIDLTFTHNGQTNQADLLAGYAVKYIALPEGIDSNRITTGVVIKPDGTVLHVPTVVTKFNNRYFALINDLRSYGTYSVIWNPRDLNDVKTHWAKDSVNNMAARLVIEGTGNNNFTPDRVITRSEFAVFIVRGLGLMHLDVEQNKFHDVSTAIWFHDAVTIANDFGIVLGYNDGAFRGDLEITREQGMAMIYRSFQLINPEASMSEDQINSVLSTYDDAHKIAPWAKEAIAMLISQGITEGKNEQLLDPKGEMTRAEAAALIQRLLKATQLID